MGLLELKKTKGGGKLMETMNELEKDSANIPICKELKENGVTSDRIKAFWGAVKKAHDEEGK